MKQKLAFIDHSFHQKTRASSFVIDILKKEYEVEFFWDESWNKGAGVNLEKISKNGFNPIVLFQVFQFPEKKIKYMGDRKVILFPMFDACPVSTDHFWENYTRLPGVKFINFSETLHERFTKFGFESKCFRYFPPPEKSPPNRIDAGELSGFFWQRTDRLNWNHIRRLIKNANFKSFNIHAAIDPPGFKVVMPTEAEIERYNIKITKWFAEKDDYLRAMRETNVFFAPRAAEGIGMSFLEAMAVGKCVAAPDNPTMNEYIDHGRTGLLYNPKRPGPLDFSGVEDISVNVRRFVEEGREKWLQAREELLDFIREPSLKKPIKKPLKLRPTARRYFLYRRSLYNLKGLIKKILPGLAEAFSGIKKIFR
jgi:glycosyltransferase involved in cell wall biosynthesis